MFAHLKNPWLNGSPKCQGSVALREGRCLVLSCHITPEVSRDAHESHVRWNSGAIHHLGRLWHLCRWLLPLRGSFLKCSQIFPQVSLQNLNVIEHIIAGVLMCWTQTTPFPVHSKKKVASPTPETPYALPLLQRVEELQLWAALLIFLDYFLLKDTDPKALQHPGSKG